MQVSLAAKDIACRRGDRVLFRGLTLESGAGDAVHIAGANGIGKTSLIRILAGLLKPFAGVVTSEGTMGLINERLALDEHRPLRDSLGFWQRLDGCGDPGRAFDLLQLGPLMDVPVRYLSTGQRKRAALARLLNRACPIWLLDEPLNGLDEQARASVEMLVAQHCGGGGIAVVASHQAIKLPASRTLALADYTPPLPGGEGIEGWGSEADRPRVPPASHTPTQPPPQGGGA